MTESNITASQFIVDNEHSKLSAATHFELQCDVLAKQVETLHEALEEAQTRIQVLQEELQAQTELLKQREESLWELRRPEVQQAIRNSMPETKVATIKKPPTETEMSMITIAPIAQGDPLRRRWKLDENKLATPRQAPMATGPLHTPTHRQLGYLRLHGTLSTGEAWETSIPFSKIEDRGDVLIGRDSQTCLIVIPDSGISRRHAAIRISPVGLTISDIGSRNGLKVNDISMDGNRSILPIGNGDILTLGEVKLLVEIMQ